MRHCAYVMCEINCKKKKQRAQCTPSCTIRHFRENSFSVGLCNTVKVYCMSGTSQVFVRLQQTAAHTIITYFTHTCHAHTSCIHTMHTHHAYTPCTHIMHTHHAHTSCIHTMHTHHARTSCIHTMH